MKKTNFLKTLLVAVGMLAGVNAAWAGEYVGSTSNDAGWWTAFSSTYTLPGENGVYNFKFTTTNDGGDSWNTWLLIATNGKDSHGSGGTEYFVWRGDSYAWGQGKSSNDDPTNLVCSNTYDAANPSGAGLQTAMNGATVEMTITRSSGNVAATAEVTPDNGENQFTMSFKYNYGNATASNMGLIFSVQNAHVEIIEAKSTNGDMTGYQYGCNFENGETLFAGRSRVTVSNVTDATLNSNVVNTFNADNTQNGYAFSDYNFSSLVNQAARVTVNFDCYLGSGDRGRVTIGDASDRGIDGHSQKNTSSSEGGIFTIGLDKNYAVLNGATNLARATYAGVWMNIDLDVDVSSKKYSYVITKKSDNSVITSGSNLDYFSAAANACSQIDIFGYINNANPGTRIDNLVITNYVDESVKFAGYTIKYMCGGTEIKTAVTDRATIEVGTYAVLLSSDKDDITYNNQKYIYVSDDADTQAIEEDGSTVITITFREAATYDYTLKAKYGDVVLEDLGSGSVFEGDRVSVQQKRFYLAGSTIVKNDNNGRADNLHYFTPNVDDYEGVIEYTPFKDNIVFFSEAEDIATLTKVSSGYLIERYSGGKGGYASEEAKVITTLGPGKYKLSAHVMGQYANVTFTFKAGSTTVLEKATGNAQNTFYVGDGYTSDEFTLTENTEITLEAGGNNGSSSKVANAVDFIYIQKTGVSATIGSTGWTTFASPYALDLSAMTASTGDVTAYYASTVTGSSVKMTETNKADVKAGEGLALYGTPSAVITIPVVASGTAIDGNLLKGCTTETELANNPTSGYNNYVLVNNGGVPEFQSLADMGATIPAGKAYLQNGEYSVGARALSIVFDDDETTGLGRIENSESSIENAVYNLQGQRINSSLRKGLYIKNGKKVIVK